MLVNSVHILSLFIVPTKYCHEEKTHIFTDDSANFRKQLVILGPRIQKACLFFFLFLFLPLREPTATVNSLQGRPQTFLLQHRLHFTVRPDLPPGGIGDGGAHLSIPVFRAAKISHKGSPKDRQTNVLKSYLVWTAICSEKEKVKLFQRITRSTGRLIRLWRVKTFLVGEFSATERERAQERETSEREKERERKRKRET